MLEHELDRLKPRGDAPLGESVCHSGGLPCPARTSAPPEASAEEIQRTTLLRSDVSVSPASRA